MPYGISSYVSRVRHFTPNARRFLAYEFFLALHLGIYGVIFNLYVLSLGYREDFLGLMLSIVFVSTGTFALPMAMLSDRIGRRRTLMLSSLVLALSLAFLYTVTSEWTFTIMSVAYGIAMACSAVAGSPFMAENSSRDERMHLFSMNSVVYTLAAIVGSLAGGVVPGLISSAAGLDLAEALPYRYTLFLSLAAVALSLLPLLFIEEKAPPPLPRRERLRLVARVVRSPAVRRLVLINVLIGTGAGMIVPFFNVYFHKVLAATTGEIGVIFSIGQLTMVIGLLLIPVLTERYGKVRTIAMTQLLSIPFLVLIAYTVNVYVAAIAYVMRMTLMNMANPAIASFNMEIVAERERATVSSLTSMGWNVFLALSTFLSGVMMAHENYLLPYMITCVVYFIAAVMYYVFFLRLETASMTSYAAA